MYASHRFKVKGKVKFYAKTKDCLDKNIVRKDNIMLSKYRKFHNFRLSLYTEKCLLKLHKTGRNQNFMIEIVSPF